MVTPEPGNACDATDIPSVRPITPARLERCKVGRMDADLIIVGAGAAGLMAAISAGRTARAAGIPALRAGSPGKYGSTVHVPPGSESRGTDARIIVLDGARSLGAKILVAGGGRCNVTHHHVDETAFAGSSRNAIRKVLRRFDVPRTIEFFRELGVELKREETGKLFPITDKARTVLNALLDAAREAGVEIQYPRRVQAIERVNPSHFRVAGEWGTLVAPGIIIATGGRSLPKTGSDGHGYAMARALGHSITPRVFPALVPLTLPADHFLCALSGIALPATLEVRSGEGKRIISFTNSTLLTHFGLSGPCVLDISRYYIDARLDDPRAMLLANWLPGESLDSVDAMLLGLGKVSPGRRLADLVPERLARALCVQAGVDPSAPGHAMRRDQRRGLARLVAAMELPVTGDRGFVHAEVTAGGVPLSEIHLETMESRLCPGLHLCGEICDVDGRIGGFNFQWAWASGYVAGSAAGRNLAKYAE
jgi:predicted Rossmann fold flavoprotein